LKGEAAGQGEAGRAAVEAEAEGAAGSGADVALDAAHAIVD
jgi:hypothetical protein